MSERILNKFCTVVFVVSYFVGNLLCGLNQRRNKTFFCYFKFFIKWCQIGPSYTTEPNSKLNRKLNNKKTGNSDKRKYRVKGMFSLYSYQEKLGFY